VEKNVKRGMYWFWVREIDGKKVFSVTKGRTGCWSLATRHARFHSGPGLEGSPMKDLGYANGWTKTLE
jgi:hypothetical protein